MKKATNKREKTAVVDPNPTAESLRELPEIDFSKYRIRRNPYAARVAREGIEILHDGPSAASLTEIPEVDYATVRIRPNPYVTRAREPEIQYGRGRPRRGEEVGATTVRSLRLPAKTWERIDAEAKARKTTAHALLREIVVRFVESLRSR
jgi:hypothetical protein